MNPPHQSEHAIDVVYFVVVSPENLAPRVFVVREPVTVLLNLFVPAAGIIDFLIKPEVRKNFFLNFFFRFLERFRILSQISVFFFRFRRLLLSSS